MRSFVRMIWGWAVLPCILLLGMVASSWGAEAQGDAERWRELCASGSIEEMREVLRTTSADAHLPGGDTLLHVAAEHASDPVVVELLLRAGASLSALGLEGLSPLMVASAYSPRSEMATALISAGASLDARDASGRTPLHLAAAMNPSPDMTAALLRHGASTRAKDAAGRTPLWSAAARGDERIVRLLLEAGSPVDEPQKDETTPLQAACSAPTTGGSPNAETIRLLVEAGADVDRRDRHRWTPTMRAVAAGASRDAIEALASGGADLLAEDDSNRGALFLAAANLSVSTDVAALLLDAEGRADPRESGLMTPLMEACRAGHLPMVRFLLDRGADTSLADKNDWTPLMFAVTSNASPELIRLLVQRGASLEDVARQGSDPSSAGGLTPLMLAIETDAAPETIETLIDLEADLDGRNAQGITPLMMAVADDRIATVRALLAGGADPSLGTWDGLAPMTIAARRSSSREMFRSLAAAGAAVDQRSAQGMTPLMVAAASGNDVGVEALLALSADVDARDVDGMTALFHAVQRQEDSSAVLDMLISAGSDVDVRLARREATPLMDAALRGNTWAMRALLEAGADARARDFIGWGTLHFAARSLGDTEPLDMLLSADVLVDARDSGGTTPLMVAAAYDDAPAVERLLEAGADPSLTDRTGRDALGYALLRKAKGCIPILERAARR